MTPPKINPGKIPPSREPNVKSGKTPDEKFFTFSLRYWNEIEHFGVGGAVPSWFASLLYRLHELCKEKVSRFIDDNDFQGALRYHIVDWDARGIPINREDLQWLPSCVLDNPTEFPIVQFQVSKAVGRVHGFWDADRCFQIVLLDPMHNLQPSRDFGYAVRPTSVAGCQYSALCTALDKARSKPCRAGGCEFAKAVMTVVPESITGQFLIMAAVTPDVAKALQDLRSQQLVSISDIVEHGITFWNDAK